MATVHSGDRFGLSSIGWHPPGISSCGGIVPHPDTFFHTWDNAFYGRSLDNQHPRLYRWEGVGYNGGRFSHNPSYHLPPQLWSLHHFHGLAVWHTSRALWTESCTCKVIMIHHHNTFFSVFHRLQSLPKMTNFLGSGGLEWFECMTNLWFVRIPWSGCN